MRSERLYLQDIADKIDEIGLIVSSVSDYDHFATSDILQSAIVFKLIVIGEAANHISQKIKKENPTIPWMQMIGMRNFAAHAYFGLSWKLIWETAMNDVPLLKPEIQKILNQLQE